MIKNLRIDELDATMVASMEGEKYYPRLALSNRKPNHLIASTRFDSDIPLPYYNWSWTMYLEDPPHNGKNVWSDNNIQTPHVPFSRVKKAAVFIARNCNSKSNRENLVRSLMAKMPVDSVSSCLHNFDIGDTVGWIGGTMVDKESKASSDGCNASVFQELAKRTINALIHILIHTVVAVVYYFLFSAH